MLVRNDRVDGGVDPGSGGWRWLGLFCCLLIPSAVMGADEDDYLKMIESEASKIEAGDRVAASESADAGASEADIGAFEQELESHYRGSYLFYKKLPRRGQEEIFLEYQKGASIDGIRKKIMNRFLHSK